MEEHTYVFDEGIKANSCYPDISDRMSERQCHKHRTCDCTDRKLLNHPAFPYLYSISVAPMHCKSACIVTTYKS